MRPTTVVSTFSPEGYQQYGQKMVETFLEHWSDEVNMILWLDEAIPFDHPRIEQKVGMPREIVEFRERHKEHPAAHGRKVEDGSGQQKYNHRNDAYRFIFLALLPSITAFTLMRRPSRMIWLDGDVHTFDRVSTEFLDQTAPESFEGSYLARKHHHPETGWVNFNLPECDDLLEAIYRVYVEDRCFSGYEGSIFPYVFDALRKDLGKNFLDLVE